MRGQYSIGSGMETLANMLRPYGTVSVHQWYDRDAIVGQARAFQTGGTDRVVVIIGYSLGGNQAPDYGDDLPTVIHNSIRSKHLLAACGERRAAGKQQDQACGVLLKHCQLARSRRLWRGAPVGRNVINRKFGGFHLTAHNADGPACVDGGIRAPTVNGTTSLPQNDNYPPLPVLLAGCGCDDNAPPPRSLRSLRQGAPPYGVPVQPRHEAWPNPYGDGFTFIFPATDGVHYLCAAGNPLWRAISITYSIDASPGAVLTIAPRPTTHAVLASPARSRPTFTWPTTATMQNEFGRWFGSGYAQELKSGSFVMGAPFFSAPEKWASVYGKNGARFLAAVSGCSGQCCRGWRCIWRWLLCRSRRLCNGRNGSNGGEQFYR